MTRVHVVLPERFLLTTEVPVLASHINYGGHLDNALLLTIVSEGRLRFFESLGYEEHDVEGAGVIIADAAVQYLSEAFRGETLVIDITPAHLHAKGFDLVWRIRDKASGRDVARGKAGMLFFDYGRRKVVAMPEAFRRRIEASPPVPSTAG
jgi:acyl-CoA thioester hydrolase